jgi:hypothetical protein
MLEFHRIETAVQFRRYFLDEPASMELLAAGFGCILFTTGRPKTPSSEKLLVRGVSHGLEETE